MISNNLKELTHQVGVPVKALSAETVSEIKDAPHAQLRTSNFKKAVFIVDDLVFKGPYGFDDTRLMNNLRRTFAIQLLEDSLNLPEPQRGSLPWEYIGQSGADIYLVAPNVGRWNDIPFELASSKIETNVPVVPRGGAVWRVSDVEENGYLINDMKLAALQHLYFRFLLDIGDSGTHNILIREDNDTSGRYIAGIDLEQNRNDNVSSSRLSLLFSKLYDKHLALYGSDVHRVKSLNYGQLGSHTMDGLHTIGIDLGRLKVNMARW